MRRPATRYVGRAARVGRRERAGARSRSASPGAGSNLRALHAAATRGELGGEIVLVFADRACPALDWAAEQGIDTALVPGGRRRRRWPRPSPAPGPTSSCSPATCGSSARTVLAAYAGRILNTHPSLLPAFPGAHAVRDALAHGVAVTGATVHLVDATLDGGPILAQEAVPILPDDDEARSARGSRPSSTACCRASSACSLAGAVAVG